MIKHEQPYDVQRASPAVSRAFDELFRPGVVPAESTFDTKRSRPEDEGPTGSSRPEIPGRFTFN